MLTTTATFDAGVLTIDDGEGDVGGTNNNIVVLVSAAGEGWVQVFDGGLNGTEIYDDDNHLAPADVSQIVIITHGGDDTVDVSALTDVAFPNMTDVTARLGVDNDTYKGWSGRDDAYGDTGNDSILGNAGDDYLSGAAGNDSIRGGTGADNIDGGDDADTIVGDAGNDTIYGGNGADLLSGGSEDDSILGGMDNDTVFGDSGNDTIYGEDGQDSLMGGAGDDYIFAGNNNGGIDSLYGGDDDDHLYSDTMDIHVGGNGTDWWNDQPDPT
jgi:Ca2+-binding RTX toxin-like protein